MDPALVNTNRPGHLPATVGIIGTPAPVTPGRVRATVRIIRSHITSGRDLDLWAAQQSGTWDPMHDTVVTALLLEHTRIYHVVHPQDHSDHLGGKEELLLLRDQGVVHMLRLHV